MAKIALIGSLATPKPIPKDADLLVTLEGAGDMDLAPLAAAGRQLKGRPQTINLGADIFLCDSASRYLGRICCYRECHARALCRARSCGRRPHLNDDFQDLVLPLEVIIAPPFELWPQVERRRPAPEDVERLLLAPLAARADAAALTGR